MIMEMHSTRDIGHCLEDIATTTAYIAIEETSSDCDEKMDAFKDCLKFYACIHYALLPSISTNLIKCISSDSPILLLDDKYTLRILLLKIDFLAVRLIALECGNCCLGSNNRCRQSGYLMVCIGMQDL